MATPLFLDSLEIRQFRTFEYLRIERLGRVNLIVGKNNVGKSSLLEALRLYAYQGAPAIIWQILDARDESLKPAPDKNDDEENLVSVVKHLFHGRHDIRSYPAQIRIGPIGSTDRTLSISLVKEKAVSLLREDERNGLRSSQIEEADTLFFGIRMDDQLVLYKLDSRASRLPESERLRCVSISANGVDTAEIGALWDSIALTNLEEEVLTALRIIVPEVERVSLVSGRSKFRSAERIPIVKAQGADEPVPLRSLGEGMSRLFGLAMALVNAKNGIFLVDEIESGLHYSVQSQVWRLVFEVAHRLNIQVFATTHSWDCLVAFQEAARACEHEEGVLIRLLERNGKTITAQFDEGELAVVAHEGIEVR